MTIPGTRQLNLAGFLACLGMMAYALYAEHYLQLAPCPLCVFQRMAVIALGIIFLIATLHYPSGWGRRVYAGLLLAAAGFGVGVAGRHVWIQNLPADQVPACGAGYDYIMETLPIGEALSFLAELHRRRNCRTPSTDPRHCRCSCSSSCPAHPAAGC